ncbi:dermonecrotic toxin domain-containing protein, partial [Pseudomonas sp. LR_7]
LRGALITAVRHRTGQLIQPWLTVDYLKNLVTRVDIGGRYPRYVAQCLDDPAERPQRAQRFARQWRCSLLFSALSAHLEGTLSEVALQCVSNYCAGHINPEVPDLTLMPLAFKRQPNSAIHDQVSAMYVLFSATPARVVLYRPLYGSTALREFTGLEALLAAICEDGPLQHSVLDWMPAHARAIYADGGFREPHISHLGPDPLDVPERPKPASLATRFWLDDVDERLYSANRDLLVELAGLQSTSNAESRWALLREGAWLLFDVVTVVLTGPVATIAWLVQLIESVNRDVESFTQGTEFERSAAVVDALLNLGMMLLHARLPSAPLPRATRLAHASSFPATLARGNAGAPLEVLPSQGKVGLPGSLRALEHRPLDFSWRGGRGFNRLTHQQREAIVGMRRDPGRTGLVAETSGSAKGLYKVDGRYYATLEGDFYPARVLEEGVRIMDEQGAFGPWLVFEHGAWRVDDGLRLRGGMPKTRRELLVQKNSEELQALNAREKELIRMLNEQGDKFKQHRELLLKRAQEIQALEQSTDNLQLDQLVLVRRLHQRIRLEIAKDLKNLVYIGLEHNQVLSDIAARRRNDATLEYALATQRNNTRQDLIEHCESYYNYLAKLINDENPGALGESLVVHPETEAEIRHYRDFRASLERVVEWQAELSELAGRFDDLLEDTLNDHTIVFKAEGESEGEADNRRVKETWVRNIIEQRRLTDVDVQFRQLLDLGELSLDRLASVEERVLEEYADYLVGEDLKSAGAAHGELTGSGLSVTECIEVLGGVHDAYEQAAAMSDYLLSLGGVAVRGESLQAYKRVLANLKESAERSLEASMREKELAEPRVSKPALYPSRGGKRRVAKTHRGRSVVVEEVEVDGAAVVQQRDFRTKQVLKTFRQEGGGWVEQDAHPTSSKLPWSPLADPVKDTRRADELLAQVDSIMSLGKQYISSDEPLGFETVIEGQIDKMQHARGKLVRTPESEALLDSLDKGIERLQLFRRDQLTTFHFSTTHPTANSLRFLHDAQAITVQRVGKRKKTASDYLQVYDVRRKGSGEGLWQVHLHYPGMETPPREFSKGHIKLWSQLSIGRDVQVRLARRKDMKAIYRGDLRLADIDGLIPLA